MAQPKWVTPERQAYLVVLFRQSGGFCVYGHKPCSIPEHHYELYIEGVITNWKADDREVRLAEWQAERRQLHSLAEIRYPIEGRFNFITKEVFFGNQPQYYLIGFAISGLTFKPFAKVRIASSYFHLHIDISDALQGVSKSKRRKAIRYGKALPVDTQKEVDRLCNLAVRHYLDN